MSRTRFSLKEMEALKENPWVSSVSALRVQYSTEFKKHFVEEYEAGKKPTVIFRECGFDPRVLGYKRIERATYRWKRMDFATEE